MINVPGMSSEHCKTDISAGTAGMSSEHCKTDISAGTAGMSSEHCKTDISAGTAGMSSEHCKTDISADTESSQVTERLHSSLASCSTSLSSRIHNYTHVLTPPRPR